MTIKVRRETSTENPVALYYVVWDSKKPGKTCSTMHYLREESARKKAEEMISKGKTGVHIEKDCCAGFAF